MPASLFRQPCLCLCFFSLQITNKTPLRLTILQFLQIFLTEACTFITLLPSKRVGHSSATRNYPLMRNKTKLPPDHSGTTVGFQICLFHQAVVLVRYQVCLNLCNKVHDDDHNDQHRGTTKIERYCPKHPENIR